MQRLEKLQEAKVLKEHLYATQCKEAMLKAHMKPWLDEAYAIITTIEGKLASLHETQQKLQADRTGPVTSSWSKK